MRYAKVKEELTQAYGASYVEALERYRRDPNLSLRDLERQFGLSRQTISQHFRRMFPRLRIDRLAKIRAKRKGKPKPPPLFTYYPELKELFDRGVFRLAKNTPRRSYLFRDRRGRLNLVRRTTTQRIAGRTYRRLRLERLKPLLEEVDYVVVLDPSGVYRVPVDALPRSGSPWFEPARYARYRVADLPPRRA